ncbi:hypothetical protein [Metapseudomonas resinovorans]|uniref:hypothetical protein n=1 Tax=Metapseudomonas resinovorans TaxID=53412 RepID=UPI0012DF212D|nr:hypothetical protein [Pseudomonas resinovorans]
MLFGGVAVLGWRLDRQVGLVCFGLVAVRCLVVIFEVGEGFVGVLSAVLLLVDAGVDFFVELMDVFPLGGVCLLGLGGAVDVVGVGVAFGFVMGVLEVVGALGRGECLVVFLLVFADAFVFFVAVAGETCGLSCERFVFVLLVLPYGVARLGVVAEALLVLPVDEFVGLVVVDLVLALVGFGTGVFGRAVGLLSGCGVVERGLARSVPFGWLVGLGVGGGAGRGGGAVVVVLVVVGLAVPFARFRGVGCCCLGGLVIRVGGIGGRVVVGVVAVLVVPVVPGDFCSAGVVGGGFDFLALWGVGLLVVLLSVCECYHSGVGWGRWVVGLVGLVLGSGRGWGSSFVWFLCRMGLCGGFAGVGGLHLCGVLVGVADRFAAVVG